ncbi:MAG: hypothetical protein WCO19_00180 [Candidatus Saccharibacteria bacterium]
MPIKKKKQSLFSKLGAKLRTPKGRLVATFLIFGAIGGGVLVYKSFAATPPSQTWNYTLGAGNAELQLYPASKCTSNKVADPKKNNMLVANISCPANDPGLSVVRTIGAYLPASYIGSNIRACAYIQGLIGHAVIQFQVMDQGTLGDSFRYSYVDKVNSSTYGYYCTPYTYLKVASRIQLSVNVGGYGGRPSFLNVGTIVLEKQ